MNILRSLEESSAKALFLVQKQKHDKVHRQGSLYYSLDGQSTQRKCQLISKINVSITKINPKITYMEAGVVGGKG